MSKHISAATLGLLVLAGSALAQQPGAEVKKSEDRAQAGAAVKKSCRNISAEIRSGAPLTRDIVIAEMVRARAEGEMDFHISSTPPAVYRPMCENPPAALEKAPSDKTK